MVGIGWLDEIARLGVIVGVDRFLVCGSVGSLDIAVDGGDACVNMQAPMDVDCSDPKEKGKEKELDAKMIDITNSEYFHLLSIVSYIY